jgi:predicted nuclease of restriction endonuclease-like (RecB) superfamily
MTVPTPVGYTELLSEIKERVRVARTRAAVAVNSELILLYWQIGNEILVRMRALGWGAGVVQILSDDLKVEFPDLKGFSARNLNYMKQLAECWPDTSILPQVVAKLPWGHHRLLLDRVGDPAQRHWYARATIQHGWSRAILDYQIDSDLYRRQGSATTNFERTLPPAQSELAVALLKDPYNFDFLGLAEDARERDVHRGLLQHLREFLMELGAGFAFVGSDRQTQLLPLSRRRHDAPPR